jgi:hypothetical protein
MTSLPVAESAEVNGSARARSGGHRASIALIVQVAGAVDDPGHHLSGPVDRDVLVVDMFERPGWAAFVRSCPRCQLSPPLVRWSGGRRAINVDLTV